MKNYYWKTDEALNTNSDTMQDYLDNHIKDDFECVYFDGSYAEIQDSKGLLLAVNASGDGDFCSHFVTFKEL